MGGVLQVEEARYKIIIDKKGSSYRPTFVTLFFLIDEKGSSYRPTFVTLFFIIFIPTQHKPYQTTEHAQNVLTQNICYFSSKTACHI